MQNHPESFKSQIIKKRVTAANSFSASPWTVIKQGLAWTTSKVIWTIGVIKMVVDMDDAVELVEVCTQGINLECGVELFKFIFRSIPK